MKIGDKNGFLITKAGLALGAGFLGAVIMAVIVGWVALGRTQDISEHQKTQINEAREANCKLKLYDVLSGRAGTLLFKKAHVINQFFEKGINHTLEIVESIPSERNCTGIFVEPKGKAKKQTGGLTPSDIRYANEVLGEILEEPRGFQRRNENKVEKNMEQKKSVPKQKKNSSTKKKENSSSEIITTPPVPINIPSSPYPISAPAVENNNNGNHEEKKEKHQEKKQEENNKNCIIEISVLNKELKVCS